MLIPCKHSGYRAGSRLYPGGKGGSAAPPDPALIQAQIKSMGIQDSAIERIMSNANDLAPLQRDQMKFGLDANRTAFKNSQEDRAYALERRGVLTGMQDKLTADAESFNSESKREELAGQAGADVEQAFQGQRESTGRQMARMGVNPNDGRFADVAGKMSMGQAAAKAGAMTTSRRASVAEGRALTDRATNALAGYPSMTMSANGQGAQMAANGINIANAGAQGINSGFVAGSQAAGGMGQNATNMWGAQANAYNQSNQGGETFGGILGGLGGLAGGAAMFM